VNKKDHSKKPNECRIPTLPQIARKVARLENTQLDEKQYIAYEMIACTFLLGLLNDGTDKNTKLGSYLQQTMEIATTSDVNDVTKKLKARGGQDQLLMFLTGPAGSGKSTAMKIAQHFC
jgi:flagellar biosynthesis GTPase FlhF